MNPTVKALSVGAIFFKPVWLRLVRVVVSLMKTKLCIAFAVLAYTLTASGQTLKRTDAIWARSTAGAAITLDGKLNEPIWARAESIRVQYGKDAGMPGSGWVRETGIDPQPTRRMPPSSFWSPAINFIWRLLLKTVPLAVVCSVNLMDS